MGTPIPPEPPWADGDDCPHCFGAGKEFGDIPTPEIVQVTFENVLPTNCNCDDHNKPPVPAIQTPLILFLTQDPVIPCYWHYNRDMINLGWMAWLEWHLPTNKSYLQLQRKIIYDNCDGDPTTYFEKLFYDTSQPICATFFDNNQYTDACLVGFRGYGGQGTIWWPEMP